MNGKIVVFLAFIMFSIVVSITVGVEMIDLTSIFKILTKQSALKSIDSTKIEIISPTSHSYWNFYYNGEYYWTWVAVKSTKELKAVNIVTSFPLIEPPAVVQAGFDGEYYYYRVILKTSKKPGIVESFKVGETVVSVYPEITDIRGHSQWEILGIEIKDVEVLPSTIILANLKWLLNKYEKGIIIYLQNVGDDTKIGSVSLVLGGKKVQPDGIYRLDGSKLKIGDIVKSGEVIGVTSFSVDPAVIIFSGSGSASSGSPHSGSADSSGGVVGVKVSDTSGNTVETSIPVKVTVPPELVDVIKPVPQDFQWAGENIITYGSIDLTKYGVSNPKYIIPNPHNMVVTKNKLYFSYSNYIVKKRVFVFEVSDNGDITKMHILNYNVQKYDLTEPGTFIDTGDGLLFVGYDVDGFILTKVDYDFNIIFDKKIKLYSFDSRHLPYPSTINIIKLEDGYLITGSYETVTIMVKLDNQFNPVLYRRYYNIYLFKGVKTSDGLLFGGYFKEEVGGVIKTKYVLIHFNKNLLLDKLYQTINPVRPCVSDNSYIIGVSTYNGRSNYLLVYTPDSISGVKKIKISINNYPVTILSVVKVANGYLIGASFYNQQTKKLSGKILFMDTNFNIQNGVELPIEHVSVRNPSSVKYPKISSYDYPITSRYISVESSNYVTIQTINFQ